jgi:hypothetical protein
VGRPATTRRLTWSRSADPSRAGDDAARAVSDVPGLTARVAGRDGGLCSTNTGVSHRRETVKLLVSPRPTASCRLPPDLVRGPRRFYSPAFAAGMER